jgi:hypothetical protein
VAVIRHLLARSRKQAEKERHHVCAGLEHSRGRRTDRQFIAAPAENSAPRRAGKEANVTGMAGRVVGLLEHTVAVVAGFVMMVVGLGLGVTMIMLPVGLVIGLAGFALFIAGLYVRFDETKRVR